MAPHITVTLPEAMGGAERLLTMSHITLASAMQLAGVLNVTRPCGDGYCDPRYERVPPNWQPIRPSLTASATRIADVGMATAIVMARWAPLPVGSPLRRRSPARSIARVATVGVLQSMARIYLRALRTANAVTACVTTGAPLLSSR